MWFMQILLTVKINTVGTQFFSINMSVQIYEQLVSFLTHLCSLNSLLGSIVSSPRANVRNNNNWSCSVVIRLVYRFVWVTSVVNSARCRSPTIRTIYASSNCRWNMPMYVKRSCQMCKDFTWLLRLINKS